MDFPNFDSMINEAASAAESAKEAAGATAESAAQSVGDAGSKIAETAKEEGDAVLYISPATINKSTFCSFKMQIITFIYYIILCF